MDLNKTLGRHASEDFAAEAARQGISVEQMQVDAKRWYLSQVQNKSQFSRAKPRLRRVSK